VPVRDREAPNGAMTANMTANMVDGRGRLWTAMESPRLRSNSAGPWWTCTDGRLAVFKTVCGCTQSSSRVHLCPRTFPKGDSGSEHESFSINLDRHQ
jgi:hypothetical protein